MSSVYVLALTSTASAKRDRAIQHTVLGLLCPPVEVRKATEACATVHAGHAGVHSPARPRAQQGGHSRGAEGFGCPLSESELLIAFRFGHEPMSWEV